MREDLTVGNIAATDAWPRAEAGWARRSIYALDAHLRRRHGIFEFTDQADCILRVACAPAPRALVLSDGTSIRQGDPLLDLHLWNEHVPTIPPGGITLGWAATAARRARASLRTLAAAAENGDLPAFVALRGCLRFDSRLLEAPFAGCGFDTIADPPASPGQWLHDLGESCLTGLLLWAFNPAGVGHARLSRARRYAWMSRTRLKTRHGSSHH
jgi:hypothetical protein